MEIRNLGESDAAEYQALRLRALREAPEAFGSTYAEEVDRPLDGIAAQLAGRGPGGGFVLGVAHLRGGALMGVAGCYREAGFKRRHAVVVWGMFVAPEARGAGAGGALLDALLAQARDWPALEQLTLSVVPENTVARALYVSRGFRSFGLAPRALRDEARYYDLEYLWFPLDAG